MPMTRRCRPSSPTSWTSSASRELRALVGGRVHRDRPHSHPPGRPDDAERNLAAVGDEDVCEHAELPGGFVYRRRAGMARLEALISGTRPRQGGRSASITVLYTVI